MILELADYQHDRGAFAVILIDRCKMRAYKLFKSYAHPDLEGTGEQEQNAEAVDRYRNKVFELELAAYKISCESTTIARYTPSFFGQVKIDRVLDRGNDVSHQYLLGCCYEMEFVDGSNSKLNVILQNDMRLQQVEAQYAISLQQILVMFNTEGIRYTIDSTGIYGEDRFVIVDFATEDPNRYAPVIVW